jgi:O-antigen/teichoic acid export membrane protein
MAAPETQETLERRIRSAAIRGVFWVSGERVSTRIVDQIFTLILVRLLSPSDFGLVALAVVFTGFLQSFSQMGLGSAIIQRKDIDEGHLSSAFWAQMGVAVLLVVVAAAGSRLFSAFTREPAVGTVALILSLGIVLTAGSAIQIAVISRVLEYRRLVVRTFIATLIGGLVGVLMAWSGMGVWSLAGQMLTVTGMTTLLLYSSAGWRPRFYFSRSKLLELWAFGMPLVVARLLTFFIRYSDNLLIGRYLGASALGYYSMAYTLFMAPVTDLIVLGNQVMTSAFSRLQGAADQFKRAFLTATRYVALVALPAVLGMALVARLQVKALFGAGWLPASPVLSILAVAGFISLMLALGPSALQAAGHSRLQLRWTTISLFVYVPAFVIGLRWQIIGVAAGYLVATVLLTPILYRYVARVTGISIRELVDALWPALTGCAVMVVVVAVAEQILVKTVGPRIPTLVALVAIGVIVYAATIWFVRRDVVLELLSLLREAQRDGGQMTADPITAKTQPVNSPAIEHGDG